MKKKARILIVDDNISQCKTMSFILEHKGYSVSIANDGLEAIKITEERPFDMIFLDIKMPLLNGVETYKRIKKIRPDAVVVMITAYAVEDLVQEALQEGAYGIIYKPVDIEKVVALIEKQKKVKQGAFVLVVDDNPGIRITLKNILKKKGCKVGTAQTGEKAITMAKEKTYDIIFIDMKLPTINGLETYLAIRKVNTQAVAIMMTAFRQEMSDLIEKALKSSAYTCIYKPFAIEKLLRLVEEICERKQKATL